MEKQSDQLLSKLQSAVVKEEHKLIYELSTQILKQHPNDIDFLQCHIISAFKTQCYKQLQNNIFKSAPSQDNLQRLYAFYLYNIGDFLAAIKYIESQKQDQALQLLLAQCYFKILNYDQSAFIMTSLLKQLKLTKDDRQSYTINLFATGLNKFLTPKTLKEYTSWIGKESSKEIYYNYALILFQCGYYEESIQQLQKFSSLLSLPMDQVDITTAMVLQNVISHKIGKFQPNDNLIKKYQESMESQDINLNGVLACNILAMNYNNDEINEALRITQESMSIKAKVSKQQLIILKMNKLSLLLRKNKLADATKIIKELENSVDNNWLLNNNEFVKSKYYLAKKNKEQKEIESLIQRLQKNGSESAQLAFYLKIDWIKDTKSVEEVINELQNGKEENPYIKNYIFSLLISNPALLEKKSEYLDQLSKKSSDINVLEILLEVYQKTENIQKQKYILQSILNLSGKNIKAKIKLGKILINEGNLKQAEELLKGIEPPQQINDMSYLHNIEKNMHISTKKEQEVQKVNLGIHKKIHKKKKVKLPKNVKFIENFKADPERWLPKWQRKGYKKKGKKTQGLATVGKDETKNTYATTASTSTKEVTKNKATKKKH